MVKLMDGSMWSALEHFGFNLEHHWTFGANRDLELLKKVYEKNLEIGVDYITTNTYHFGSTLEEISERDKYEQYFENACHVLEQLAKPSKILGSVGTFATYFHDCSEYTGAFADLPNIQPKCNQYFRTIFEKFQNLSKIRHLIIETISTRMEVLEILKVLKDFPEFKIIFSFTLGKAGNLRHGENLAEVLEDFKNCEQVIGVGINCTDPSNILEGLQKIGCFQGEIFVYPNIGDNSFLASDKNHAEFVYDRDLVQSWILAGATVIGGCCGVKFKHLEQLKNLI
ncbi:unnamed protein product [Caenorhabditis angaria]|uniref:Hcy-binding domain-containing protein n=1 Tax=Caenorhabditis angaria TaxID=860376 RepID=A0A9P1NA42_9PELO|nr:unnamed protein product [Caenorhabditis angaria]